MQGKIKFYKQDKRYGFIVDSVTLKDIFFHKIGIIGNYIPSMDDKVTFELGEYKNMKVATKIEQIQNDANRRR